VPHTSLPRSAAAPTTARNTVTRVPTGAFCAARQKRLHISARRLSFDGDGGDVAATVAVVVTVVGKTVARLCARFALTEPTAALALQARASQGGGKRWWWQRW